MNWLVFALMTVASWGLYGIFLHSGQTAMADKSNALFKFRKLNASPPVEVARGVLTVVCVRHRSDGTMAACKIPPLVARKIQVAPAKLLGGKADS